MRWVAPNCAVMLRRWSSGCSRRHKPGLPRSQAPALDSPVTWRDPPRGSRAARRLGRASAHGELQDATLRTGGDPEAVERVGRDQSLARGNASACSFPPRSRTASPRRSQRRRPSFAVGSRAQISLDHLVQQIEPAGKPAPAQTNARTGLGRERGVVDGRAINDGAFLTPICDPITMSNAAMPPLLPVYKRAEITFERGRRDLFDREGRRYLDFGSGIAVTLLGRHPLVAVLEAQAEAWPAPICTASSRSSAGRALGRALVRGHRVLLQLRGRGAGMRDQDGAPVPRARPAGAPSDHHVRAPFGRTLATISAGGQDKYLEDSGPACPASIRCRWARSTRSRMRSASRPPPF